MLKHSKSTRTCPAAAPIISPPPIPTPPPRPPCRPCCPGRPASELKSSPSACDFHESRRHCTTLAVPKHDRSTTARHTRKRNISLVHKILHPGAWLARESAAAASHAEKPLHYFQSLTLNHMSVCSNRPPPAYRVHCIDCFSRALHPPKAGLARCLSR
jgi:hypothetical protein